MLCLTSSKLVLHVVSQSSRALGLPHKLTQTVPQTHLSARWKCSLRLRIGIVCGALDSVRFSKLCRMAEKRIPSDNTQETKQTITACATYNNYHVRSDPENNSNRHRIATARDCWHKAVVMPLYLHMDVDDFGDCTARTTIHRIVL